MVAVMTFGCVMMTHVRNALAAALKELASISSKVLAAEYHMVLNAGLVFRGDGVEGGARMHHNHAAMTSRLE